MEKPFKIICKNPWRDISIAIAYQNRLGTFKSIGIDFDLTPERVRKIHHKQIRYVLSRIGKYTCYAHAAKNRCESTLKELNLYKQFIEWELNK